MCSKKQAKRIFATVIIPKLKMFVMIPLFLMFIRDFQLCAIKNKTGRNHPGGTLAMANQLLLIGENTVGIALMLWFSLISRILGA